MEIKTSDTLDFPSIQRGRGRLLIALDLDGTLTNSEKKITPKTKEALMEAQERGARIVLASGRPTYGIMPVAEELELERHGGFILAFNGGKIVDCKTRKVVFEHKLDPDVVPVLYDETMRAGLQILVHQGAEIVATSSEDRYVKLEAGINKMPIVQCDDFLNQITYPINKCLIVGDPTPLCALEQRILELLKGRISAYRSMDNFLECVPLGIDKGHSLKRLAATLGIDREEIIACGDSYNDVGMIKFAGLGVAMANAPRDIQEIADVVTLSNDNDGVAQVVEKYVL